MEALGGYPTKSSNPKAKRFTVLLSMTIGVGCLFLLQTKLAKPRKPKDFYSFEVRDAKGRTVSLERYRGKVSPHQHFGSVRNDCVQLSQSSQFNLGYVHVLLGKVHLFLGFKTKYSLFVLHRHL